MRVSVLFCFAGLAVSSHSAEIQPVQAKTIEPYHAKTIEPFKAQTIEPAKPPIQPLPGTTISNKIGDSIKPLRANTIEPFRGTGTIKQLKPAGIDPVKNPGPLDQAILGAWDISIPGVAYQTETDRGTHLERKLHVGTGAGMGVLTIQPDGSFVWVKSGYKQTGRLQQVLPRNFADPKKTYWRIHHGKDVYYIASETPGELTVYSPGSNLFAAAGKKRKS
jgi:hypothetical protein